MKPDGIVEDAFKQLFAQEYSKLCRYALSYLSDTHQAEDVVQETFIKVWERKQDMIASPDMRFYLLTAVRNNCISALRKLKSGPISFPEHAPEPEPEIHFTALQHQESAHEQTRRITHALDLLPPKCKEVFLLVKMQGLSYQQTADVLGISNKTVENQMGKALKTLRENLLLQLVILIVLLLPYHFRKMCTSLWQYLNLN